MNNNDDLRLQILTTLTWAEYQREVLVQIREIQQGLLDDHHVRADDWIEGGVYETLYYLHTAWMQCNDLIAALQDHLQRLDEEAEDEAAMLGMELRYLYLI